MLHNFRIDKSMIEAKFTTEENGKTYKVLKQGVSSTSTYMDSKTFKMQMVSNKLEDADFEYKPARLVFDKIKVNVTYKDRKYIFDPCNDTGIDITNSFDQIKEFISIWSYLNKELYVLEVPKVIRKEEIGLFSQIYDKKAEEEESEKILERAIKNIDLVKMTASEIDKTIKISEEGHKLLENLTLNHEAPKVDAYNYTDEILKFNEDNFKICEYYLDKKILGTPELRLFIKNRFNTSEQISFYWALVPAHLSIIVSLAIPFLQKQDNTESIKIQEQLIKIQQEISQLETTNMQLQSVIDRFDDLNIEKYDDRELKEILSEIIRKMESRQVIE